MSGTKREGDAPLGNAPNGDDRAQVFDSARGGSAEARRRVVELHRDYLVASLATHLTEAHEIEAVVAAVVDRASRTPIPPDLADEQVPAWVTHLAMQVASERGALDRASRIPGPPRTADVTTPDEKPAEPPPAVTPRDDASSHTSSLRSFIDSFQLNLPFIEKRMRDELERGALLVATGREGNAFVLNPSALAMLREAQRAGASIETLATIAFSLAYVDRGTHEERGRAAGPLGGSAAERFALAAMFESAGTSFDGTLEAYRSIDAGLDELAALLTRSR